MAGMKRKRSWGWLVFLLLVGAIVAYVKTRPEEALAVKAVAAGRGSVAVSVAPLTAGEVLPAARAIVSAESIGIVKELRKRKGDRVSAGEVILRLDTEDLKDRLAQAQAGILSARSAVKQAELRTDTSRVANERQKKLGQEGVATQAELERTEAEFLLSSEGVEAARAQLKLAETNVALARNAIENADVLAPFAGILADPPSSSMLAGTAAAASLSRVEVGSLVTAGVSLFEVVDTSKLFVEAAFDELDAGRLSVGMSAALTFDALPGVTITGTISSLDPTFTKDAKGARMRVIRISLPDDPRLVVGMGVDVEIEIERHSDVLAVPSNLISGRGVKRTVWVVENNRAVQRELKVGLSSWNDTEILEGLKEGDLIITSLDNEELAEGKLLKVEVTQPETHAEATPAKSAPTLATPAPASVPSQPRPQ
jgi:HlyD family secretion protein